MVKPSRTFLIIVLLISIANIAIAIYHFKYPLNTISYYMGIFCGGTLIFIYMKMEQLDIGWNDRIKIVKLVKIWDIVKVSKEEKDEEK